MSFRRRFDIGQMRHRIRVYATTRVDDGAGGFTRTDPSGADLIGKYWGHIEPINYRERQWGEQFTELTTHICWLRYNSLIKEGMTLMRTQRNANIEYYVQNAFDPDNGMNEYLMLALREGGPM